MQRATSHPVPQRHVHHASQMRRPQKQKRQSRELPRRIDARSRSIIRARAQSAQKSRNSQASGRRSRDPIRLCGLSRQILFEGMRARSSHTKDGEAISMKGEPGCSKNSCQADCRNHGPQNLDRSRRMPQLPLRRFRLARSKEFRSENPELRDCARNDGDPENDVSGLSAHATKLLAAQ